MNHSAKKRILSMLICLVFTATIFLSVSFTIEHANHDCEDFSCEVCLQIHNIEKLLKRLSLALISTAVLFGLFATATILLKPIEFLIGVFTLVQLKVRLNN